MVWTCLPFIWSGHKKKKKILQGTVKGGRRQDRQKKRWEDNIREWTGLEFAKSRRAVENRCRNDPYGLGIDEGEGEGGILF